MKVKIQVVIENDEGTVEDECVKKSGVRRGMAFEINVDSRLPNSPLRRKPNVSIQQKLRSPDLGLLDSHTSCTDPRLLDALHIARNVPKLSANVGLPEPFL